MDKLIVLQMALKHFKTTRDTFEEGVWAAVLEESVKEVIDGNMQERREALLWFKSNEPETCVGSFLYACNAVELDPGRIYRIVMDSQLQESLPSNRGLECVRA